MSSQCLHPVGSRDGGDREDGCGLAGQCALTFVTWPGAGAVKLAHLLVPPLLSYVRRMTPCMTTMLKRRGRGGRRPA